MVNKVAFINGKGGVGKTTSIFHVAGVLAQNGEKVLVIDLDKQRNASDILLMNSEEVIDFTVFDVMRQAAWLEAGQGVYKALWQNHGNANSKYYGVDVIPADIRLEDETELRKIDRLKFGVDLNSYIATEGYTWVLVDMPPSNRIINEICLSHIVNYVVVPLSPDMYSFTGYQDLIDIVNRARDTNDNLHILGAYLSRYDFTRSVEKEILKEARGKFDADFIDVQIPYRDDIRVSVMFGRPISYYYNYNKILAISKKTSKNAYEKLVVEIKRRIDVTR